MVLIFLTRRFRHTRPNTDAPDAKSTRELTVKLHRMVRRHEVPYNDRELQDTLAETLRSVRTDMQNVGGYFKRKAAHMHDMLQKTLNADAASRPTVNALLLHPTLCFACYRLCPRVDFSIFFRGQHTDQIKQIQERAQVPSAETSAPDGGYRVRSKNSRRHHIRDGNGKTLRRKMLKHIRRHVPRRRHG